MRWPPARILADHEPAEVLTIVDCVGEVLHVLYLGGLSTATSARRWPLLGNDAASLSATDIARLTHEWEIP
jgi:hypothetical protein